ncbi:hypothetical protein BDZ85DRAFT_286210 [Elsinoe ampelina]|uniref:Uncharacterized protein n=1 Tax=Elsinoe ampelina TaxID=302913 RepID=A0A6A6FYV0_9PEZI|nr:hypothetical protein BDZ85DRAFT_286210 [Elsinoe ampelina]
MRSPHLTTLLVGTSIAHLTPLETTCNRTFPSLSALSANRTTIPPSCLHPYILTTLSTTYTTSLQTYRHLLSTSPSLFTTLLSSLHSHVPARITDYLQTHNSTQFLCLWTSPSDTPLPVPCPGRSTAEHCGTTTWTVPNETLSLSTLYASFGVTPQWVRRGDITFPVPPPAPTASPARPMNRGFCEVEWTDFLLPCPPEDISLAPPLGLIEAALDTHEAFASLLASTAEQVREGTYPSSPGDASSAFALPVAMLVSAAVDLQRATGVVRPTSQEEGAEGGGGGELGYCQRRTVLDGFAKALLLTLPAMGPIAALPPLEPSFLLSSVGLVDRSPEPGTVLASIDVLARLVLPLSQTWWGGYLVLTSADQSEGGGATERKMALLREGRVDEAAEAVAGTGQWEREGVRSLLEREVRSAVDLLGVVW